LFIAGSSS